MENNAQVSLFYRGGKIFWSKNVITNVLLYFEPKDLAKGKYKRVNKNFQKATLVVLDFWRFDATKIIEKNLEIINLRAKEFSESEQRAGYRETSS